MADFNTHGGYFAPKGWMEINAGGSHEENPNGGVQIGVDEQGIPNMLEEGEPVYDDYVYSDNIKADARILKKMNLPEKYGGKLYSEIAEDLLKEAEERPLDPISNNGLQAMLGRLADSQEEQKARSEKRELKKEIESLSPEELAMLESALSGEEAVPAEQQVTPEVAQQPMALPGTMPQMMANGGILMRKFEEGTPGVPMKVNNEGELVDEIEPSVSIAFPGKTQAWVDAEVGPNSIKKKVSNAGNKFVSNSYDVFRDIKTPFYFVPGIGEVMLADDFVHGLATGNGKEVAMAASGPLIKGAKIGKAATKMVGSIDDIKGNIAQWEDILAKATSDMEAAKNITYKEVAASETSRAKEQIKIAKDMIKKLHSDLKSLTSEATESASHVSDSALSGEKIKEVGKSVGNKAKNMGKKIVDPLGFWRRASNSESAFGKNFNKVAGSAVNFGEVSGLSLLGKKTYNLINDVSSSKEQGQWGEYDPGSKTFVVNDNAKGGRIIRKYENADGELEYDPEARPNLEWYYNRLPKETFETNTNTNRPPALPTFPRYSGAIMSGILGLHNLAQTPDRYRYQKMIPSLVTGNLPVQMQRYLPADINLSLNAVQSQGNASTRAIANAGLGPSTGANLIANNAVTTNALGNAFMHGQLANNQQRNAVIAANNQALAQQAAYNMRRDQINSYALNQAQAQNIQNDITEQRLNYEAEGQKYAAIQNQLDQLGAALSSIGRENFMMNQLNGDDAYRYFIAANGLPFYKSAKCGGKIKTKK